MKQLSVTGYVVSFLLSAVMFLSPVQALEAESTPVQYFPRSSPLQVSAIKFANDGSLSYIEIYNDSDTLLDPTLWSITGDFKVPSCESATKCTGSFIISRSLSLTNILPGKIMPGKHAIVNGTVVVTNASYASTGWQDALPTLPSVDTRIVMSASLTVSRTGYKSDVYAFKSPLNDDSLYRRARSTSGYVAMSSTAFSTATSENIYDDGLYIAPNTPPIELYEMYAYSSDCAPEDTSPLCGDYIKFKLNGSLKNIEDYVVRTDNSSSSRTTANTFSLANAEENGDFLTIRQDDSGKPLSLTNSGGYIWVEDKYEGIRYGDSVPYPSFSSEHQAWSWMLDSDNVWKWTNTPQPGLPNKLSVPPPPVEVIATCPEGKYLNPDTNRCRTVEEAVNALAACPEGQERNLTTNRCRSLVNATSELTPCDEGQERNPATNRCRSKVLAAATLVPCGEGQERNPATNRCRSIASAVAELLPCDEGYERNPATNRCRKVLAAVTTVGATPVTVVEDAKGTGWNAWTWALVAVGATGAIGYGVYEWRHELGGFGQKVVAKLGKK